MSELNDELEDLDSDDDYIPAEVVNSYERPIEPNYQATGLAVSSDRAPPPYIQRSQTRPAPRSAPRARPKVYRKLAPKFKLKGYNTIAVFMDDKIIIFK